MCQQENNEKVERSKYEEDFLALNKILKEKTSELEEYVELSERLQQEKEQSQQSNLLILDEYKRSLEETTKNEMGLLKGKVEMLEKLLEERKEEVSGSDRELRIRYETVAFELEARIDELISQVSNKENEINELTEEVKSQDEKIKNLLASNHGLQKEVDLHRTSIVPNFEARVKELEKQLGSQQEKTSVLELESKQKKVKIEEFEAVVTLKDRQLEEKSDLVKRSQAQYTELESWFAKSCKEFEEKCAEATKLKSSLEVQTTTSANLLKQIHTLESGHLESSDRMSTLQSTSEDSRRKLEETERVRREEHDRLTTALLGTQEENGVLRKDLQRATEECNQAEVKMRDVQAKHTELKKETGAIEKLLKELQVTAKEQEIQLAEAERREELLLSENKASEEEMKAKWRDITREMDSKLSGQTLQIEELTAKVVQKTDEIKILEQNSKNLEIELQELKQQYSALFESEKSLKEVHETQINQLKSKILEESNLNTETIDRLEASLAGASQQKLSLAIHSEKIEAKLKQLETENEQISAERQKDKVSFEEQLKAIVTQNEMATESLVNEAKYNEMKIQNEERQRLQLIYIKEIEEKLEAAKKEAQEQNENSKSLYDQLKSKHTQELADLEVSQQTELVLVRKEQEAKLASLKEELKESQENESETYNQRIRELERIQADQLVCRLEEQKESILKAKDLEISQLMEGLEHQIGELEEKYKLRIEQLNVIYYETKQDLEERLQSKTNESLTSKSEMERLRIEIDQTRQRGEKEASESKEKIEVLGKEIEVSGKCLKERELEVKASSEQIARLQEEISEQTALIDELRTRLKGGIESETSSLRLDLEGANSKVKEFNETISRLNEETAKQRSDIQLLNEEISRSKLEKAIRDQSIEQITESTLSPETTLKESERDLDKMQLALLDKESLVDSTVW
jgi:hypothetical protein